MPPSEQVIGVKEFLAIINETLTFAYPSVTVEGEVSEFKVKDKFVFFTLKDGDASMAVFMMVFQLKTPIEDGMKVVVSGGPKVTQWGKFSFTAKTVAPSGEGALKRAYELLKAQLEQEGLFAAERKRPLPAFPQRIGLITSEKSDAYHDFLDRVNQRWGGVTIVLAPVAVQGTSAPEQIAAAIAGFNQASRTVDVVVLTRGGGGLEDLQAFNTETVVRAVAASRAPIIVGVGHEANTSLADLAADVRAATPTAAAILAVPDRAELANKLAVMEQGWSRCLAHMLQRVAGLLEGQLNVLKRSIELPRIRLERAEQVLTAAFERLSLTLRNRLDVSTRLINSLNPRAVMGRGYAIARLNGKVLKSAAAASAGDSLMVELHEGNLHTVVDDER